MNLMLTATCNDTDAFYEAYLAMKPEFADSVSYTHLTLPTSPKV